MERRRGPRRTENSRRRGHFSLLNRIRSNLNHELELVETGAVPRCDGPRGGGIVRIGGSTAGNEEFMDALFWEFCPCLAPGSRVVNCIVLLHVIWCAGVDERRGEGGGRRARCV